MRNPEPNRSWPKYLGASLLAASLGAMAFAAIGCGKSPSSAGGTATDTGVPGGDASVPSGTVPQFSKRFKITGGGTAVPLSSGSLKVTTDSLLTVRISAGQGLPLSGGYGQSVGFNCELFHVTVGNITKPAFVKKAGYPAGAGDPCAGATDTWTADFSHALSPGHGDVPILINGPLYDNCRLTGGYGVYVGGCPLTTVYQTHSVDGLVEAFTD
jgi:hypothetical protein